MSSGALAAIDVGASSGRVVIGHVGPDLLRIDEAHRFANEPVAVGDGLYSDVSRLYLEILEGLRAATRTVGPLRSVGIDTWGVDFGLLDGAGELIGNPRHYRDPRHARGLELVDGIVPQERLYARTGIQVMPFNTVFQLGVLQEDRSLGTARTMLLLPDLFAYWLTGSKTAEMTNASTTGLLDAQTRTWASDVIDALGFPASLFAPLSVPGDSLGPVRATVARGAGLADPPIVTAVGSHDTASAVVAVPTQGGDFAFVSCGTWGLVGLELEAPILTEASRRANFTNEAGVDGRVRYLRNVMGLWLLQETLRTWERSGSAEDLDHLLEGAATMPAGGPWIDPDDPTFLPPGDMVARIELACDRADQPRPASRVALVRCILDSLAFAFARTVDDARRLAGRQVDVVHLVGGGARNDLLCQLTADACGLPVVAGPVEATALGNILIQARTLGQASGSLESLRALVRSTQSLRRFEPRLHSSPVNA